jgi:hypothetical protein
VLQKLLIDFKYFAVGAKNIIYAARTLIARSGNGIQPKRNLLGIKHLVIDVFESYHK